MAAICLGLNVLNKILQDAKNKEQTQFYFIKILHDYIQPYLVNLVCNLQQFFSQSNSTIFL